jgi:hypothetical protein
MEYLSTTALANELDIPVNELFADLKGRGWIERRNDKWTLTELGKNKGGQIRSSPKYGEFIVWPEGIDLGTKDKQNGKAQFLNATTLGKHFGVTNQRLNLILSELGWIEDGVSGWTTTRLGKTIGGRQLEHDTSGRKYVIWPDTIIQNKNLIDVFTFSSPDKTGVSSKTTTENVDNSENFREKFEAKHRTQDGHFVRSKSEAIIDNLLYQYGIVHAYERKLPIDEDVYCDFYLPTGKVYIEFWGLEDDPKYLDRKKKKLEIYKKYGFNLIELNEQDIQNLDDHLPKKLLKYNIKVY